MTEDCKAPATHGVPCNRFDWHRAAIRTHLAQPRTQEQP
jgi:hypothetical protein